MLLSRCAQWFKDLWDAEVKWMQELPELPAFGVKVDRSKWHWDLAYFTYIETCFNTLLLQQSQQLQLSQGSLPIHFRSVKRLDVSAFRMASASPMQTGSSSRLTSQILAQTKTENFRNHWKHLSRKLNVGTGLAMSPQIARHEWTAAASMHRSISWFSACNFLKTKQKT